MIKIAESTARTKNYCIGCDSKDKNKPLDIAINQEGVNGLKITLCLGCRLDLLKALFESCSVDIMQVTTRLNKKVEMESTNVDMFDVFEDRVKSLLYRWTTFKKKHPHVKNIDSKCILGCLGEINDEYTKQMTTDTCGKD